MSFSKIKIQDEEVEITKDIVEIYKNQTGKKRISRKGMEKFFNSLITKFKSNLIF